MFGLKSISIEFLTGQPFLVVLGLIVLLGLSFVLYFRTNPPLRPYLKAILVVVRVVAVLALIIALSEPVVSYTREFTRAPRVSFLVDRSISMQQNEQGKSRQDRLDSLLESSDANVIKSSADVATYYFGGDLSPDATKIKTDRTALGEAIRQLDKLELDKRADYWILFSDGNNNAGEEPAEAASGLKVPIMTVGLAAGEGGFDVALQDLEYNPILFVAALCPTAQA